MTISGKIAIAGVYEHPTRFAPDKTDSLIMAECARGALEEAGLSLSDVDGPVLGRHFDGPDGCRATRGISQHQAAASRQYQYRRLVLRGSRQPCRSRHPRRTL